jgi:hypothetical protein
MSIAHLHYQRRRDVKNGSALRSEKPDFFPRTPGQNMIVEIDSGGLFESNLKVNKNLNLWLLRY